LPMRMRFGAQIRWRSFPANASYDDFSSVRTPQNRSAAKQLSACFRRLY